jgi:hypothetical protein
VGFGFQADRYFLGGQHMHNAFLHVFFQAGFLGGGAIIIGLAIVWAYMIKYFFLHQPADRSLIPPEIPAVFLFVTISSFTESTFAYFSAAWLLSAPIVAYVAALHRHMHRISLNAIQERVLRFRFARRNSRVLGSQLDVAPPPAALAPGTENPAKSSPPEADVSHASGRSQQDMKTNITTKHDPSGVPERASLPLPAGQAKLWPEDFSVTRGQGNGKPRGQREKKSQL